MSAPSAPSTANQTALEAYVTRYTHLSKAIAEGGDIEPRLQAKLKVLTEMKDNLDQLLSHHFSEFLKFLFPHFFNDLRQGQPQFADTTEQKIRNTLLEIFNRLPNNEQLRPLVLNLLRLVMYLLEVENEENAIVCLRIIIDLHKSFRPTLENEVQPFIDTVQKIYQELPNTINYIFSGQSRETGADSSTAVPDGTPGSQKSYLRSIQSCKVLTECPIIVVLLFQLYPRFTGANIPMFMPLIVRTLGLTPPPNAAKEYPNQYLDFIAAQVKTLSFLAYMMRGVADHLRPYKDNIPKYVLQLLVNTPPQAAAIRKELLIATRHILATDFRNGFASHITKLLDENVMVGTGKTCRETLRPLAYSTLADLVHHVRNQLPLPHLCRVVMVYAQNLHDPTLPFGIQTMSAKLLLNLVTPLANKGILDRGMDRGASVTSLPSIVVPSAEFAEARRAVVFILETFTNKFASLSANEIAALAEAKAKNLGAQGSEEPVEARAPVPPVMTASSSTGGIATLPSLPSASSNAFPDSGGDDDNDQSDESRTRENLSECRLMLKALVVGLKPVLWNYVSLSQGMQYPAEERQEFSRLLREGLRCCDILVGTSDEKEVLDQFAAVFTMLESSLFRHVIRANMQFIFDKTIQAPATIAIAQQFLTRAAPVARCFGEILLEFMLPKLPHLGTYERTEAELIVKLFKLVFYSITMFEDNEGLLVPHLQSIVTTTLNQVETSSDPTLHFALLRGLTRAIVGGKYELLYCEFLPLLPSLLDSLNKNLVSATTPKHRQFYAEMCLSLPVRFSALMPYIGLLLPSIVLAFKRDEGEDDLFKSAVKMLDLLLDNISPGLLRPVLLKFRRELMSALVTKSTSIHIALIIGKLSSVKGIFDGEVDLRPDADAPLCSRSVIMSVQRGERALQIPLDPFIFTCEKVLEKAAAGDASLSVSRAYETVKGTFAELPELRSGQEKVFRSLLRSLFLSLSIQIVSEDAQTLLGTLAERFASSRLFVDALVSVYSSDREKRENLDVALPFVDATMRNYLLEQLVHLCFLSEWHEKHGGLQGIAALISSWSGPFPSELELPLVQALLHVVKTYSEESLLSVGDQTPTAIGLTACKLFKGEQVLEYLCKRLSHTNRHVRSISAAFVLELKKAAKDSALAGWIMPAEELVLPQRSFEQARLIGVLGALEFCMEHLSAQSVPRAVINNAVALCTEVVKKQADSAGSSLSAAAIKFLAEAASKKLVDAKTMEAISRDFAAGVLSRSSVYAEASCKGLISVLENSKLSLDKALAPLLERFQPAPDQSRVSLRELQACAAFLQRLPDDVRSRLDLGSVFFDRLKVLAEEESARKAETASSTGLAMSAPLTASQPATVTKVSHLAKTQDEVRSLVSLLALSSKGPTIAEILEVLVVWEDMDCNEAPLRALSALAARNESEFSEHCLTNLSNASMAQHWLSTLEAAGENSVNFLSNPKLVNLLRDRLSTQKDAYAVFTILMMTQTAPKWFATQPELFKALVEMFKSDEIRGLLTTMDMLPLFRIREYNAILKCVVNYLEFNEDEVDMMFDLMFLFTFRLPDDTLWLNKFFKEKIAQKSTLERKKKILGRFVIMLRSEQPEITSVALRVLVYPTLKSCIKDDDVSEEFLQQMLSSVSQHMDGEFAMSEARDELAIELLNFTSLVVRFRPKVLMDFRKQLLGFAWKYLKNQDFHTRQSAYVVVCRFMQQTEAYQTPEKIIYQVWVSLLKAYYPEAKKLVRKAIDVLIPVLREHAPTIDADGHVAVWAKWVAKILRDEAHHTNLVVHVIGIIVRHANDFYDARHSFIGSMIGSLLRILQPTQTLESKELSMKVVQTILNWQERWAQTEKIEDASTEAEGTVAAKQEPGTLDAAGNAQAGKVVSRRHSEFVLRPMQEQLSNFLVRMATTPADGSASSSSSKGPRGSVDIGSWAIELFDRALSLWPEMPTKVTYIERMIEGAKDNQLYGSVGLRLFRALVARQSDFAATHTKNLQTVCTTMLSLPSVSQLGYLAQLLQEIANSYPAVTSDEARVFWQEIGKCIVAVRAPMTSVGSISWAPIFETMSNALPGFVGSDAQATETVLAYLSALMKGESSASSGGSSAMSSLSGSAANASRADSKSSDAGAAAASTSSAANSTSSATAASSASSAGGSSSSISAAGSADVALSNAGAMVMILNLLFRIPEVACTAAFLSIVEQIASSWTDPVVVDALESAVQAFLVAGKVEFVVKIVDTLVSKASATSGRLFDMIASVYDTLSQEERALLHGVVLKGVSPGSKMADLWMQSFGSDDVVTRFVHAIGKETYPASDLYWYRNVVLVFMTSGASGRGAAEAATKRSKTTAPAVDEDVLAHIAFDSLPLSRELFSSLLPVVWSLCSDGQRLALTLQMSKFFEGASSPGLCNSLNAVATLLHGFSACDPLPIIDPKLVASLAVPFVAYGPAHTLLHRYVQLPNQKEMAVASLAKLFHAMNKPQLAYGVLRMLPSKTPAMDCAVGLMQQGRWEAAQNRLLTSMENGEGNSNGNGGLSAVEDLWTDCAKRLEQWDLLVDYGKATGNVDLLLDCAWKADDWRTIQMCVMDKKNSKLPSAKAQLVHSMMLIVDNDSSLAKPDAIKATLSSAIQLGLKEWAGMPRISTLTDGHRGLADLFHRLVEIQDSVVLVRDITNTKRRANAVQDIRNRFSLWRDRVPDLLEDPLVWSDLLVWRHHIFGLLMSSGFLSSLSMTTGLSTTTTEPPLDPMAINYMGYHELAWSLCTYARATRKQHLVSNALNSLEKVYSLPNIQLDDAFYKLKEQVQCYMQLPASEQPNGLSILASTHTEFFSKTQQAQWNVLRGQLLHAQASHERLKDGKSADDIIKQANHAFTSASTEEPTFPQCWIQWGRLCHEMVHSAETREERNEWDKYLFSCYLQAVVLSPERGHKFLASLLMQLNYSDNREDYEASWEKYQKDIPQWLFVDHLPQMILSIVANPDRGIWEQSLRNISHRFAYQVYNHVRSYQGMLESARGRTGVPKKLASRLDKAIKSLGRLSEWMLAENVEVVRLEKTLQVLEAEKWYGGELCKELEQVMRLLEADQLGGKSASFLGDAKSIIDALDGSKYQLYSSQLGDIQKAAKSAKSASALYGKCQSALAAVQAKMEEEAPGYATRMGTRLVACADEYLLALPYEVLRFVSEDLWDDTTEMRFLPKVDVVRGQVFLHMCGPTGQVHRYELQFRTKVTDLVRDCRYVHLRRRLNDYFRTSDFCRRQNIQMPSPFSLLCAADVGLVEVPGDTRQVASLWDICEHVLRTDPKQAVFNALQKGDTPAQVAQSLIPMTTLSHYVSSVGLCSNAEALIVCKDSFTKSLSIQCALSHMFRASLDSLTPEKFCVVLPRGLVACTEFAHPQYALGGGQKLVMPDDATLGKLHMRLTPNISNFVGPVLFDGVLAPVFFAFQKMLVSNTVQIRSNMEMFLRDDAFLWALEQGHDVFAPEANHDYICDFAANIASSAKELCDSDGEKEPIDAAVGLLLRTASRDFSDLSPIPFYAFI